MFVTENERQNRLYANSGCLGRRLENVKNILFGECTDIGNSGIKGAHSNAKRKI